MAFEFDAGSARPVDDAGGAAGFDPTTATPLKKTGPGIGAKAADLGLSLAKGVISVPEAAVGLADIPTGGAAGKAVEGLGVRFKDAKQVLTDLQSDDLKAKQQEFQQADGIIDKAGVALSNPSLVLNTAAESLPFMGAGGVAARGVALLLARAGMSARAIPAAAGAIGEGIAGAGSAAEQIRQETPTGELTAAQSGLALGSGAATAGLGALGGAAARRLGIADPDAMIAAGTRNVLTPAVQGAAKQAPRGVLRRMGEGVVAEGLLEEVPQSLAEQAIQNVALDKPVTEGLADAAVLGGLAGGVMGAGAGALSRPAVAPPPPAPTPAPGPLTQAAMLALPAPGQIPPGETIMVDSQGTAARRSDFDLQRGQPDSVGDFEAGVHNRPNRETGDIGQGRGSESANFPLQEQQPGELTEAAPPPAGPLATAARMAPQPSQPQPVIDGPRAITGPDTITDGGQPFRNGIAAQRAARSAGLGFGVVPVDGGYVVRRTNDEAQDVTPRAPSSSAAPATPLLESSVDMGAHVAATSPLNDTREPTDPQKNAENYRVGRAKVGTFHVAIENPQGSVRSGKDEDGKAWETPMTAHYGRLPGTKAADWTPQKPQQIDAFVKPGTRADHDGPVFVIDQVNPKTGRMDEHKIVFGAADEAEAEAIYRSNYTPGWNGLGSITRLDPRAFKEWAYDGTQKTEPVGRLDRWRPQAAGTLPRPAPDRATAVQRPGAGPVAPDGQPAAAPRGQQPPAVAPSPSPAPTAAPKGALRVGITPNDAEPVTVRAGVVYIGKYAATNFDTGEDVTVPEGANDLQIRKALADAGALSKKQKFFGGAAAREDAPAPTAASAPVATPVPTSAPASTARNRFGAAFYNLDAENAGDLHALLSHKFAKRGALTRDDVPMEFSEGVDTAAWMNLKDAIAQNPQEFLAYLAEKAARAAARAGQPTSSAPSPSAAQQAATSAPASDNYLKELFGASSSEVAADPFAVLEREAANGAEQQRADAKRIRDAIGEQKKRAQTEYDDWSSRVYKINRAQVDLRGDGPSNQASLSIGAINEIRRRNAMEALSQEMRALDKLADEVSTDSGAERVQAILSRLYEQAAKIAADGTGLFKTADEQFQYMLLDDLKFRGPSGKGNVTSNSLSKAMLSAIKPSTPAPTAAPAPTQPPATPAPTAAPTEDPAGAHWTAATPAEREAIVLAAGWKKGSPKTADLVAAKWEDLNELQRGKLEKAMPAEEPAPAAPPRKQPGDPEYTLLDARNDLIEMRQREANQGRVVDDRLAEQIRRQIALVRDMEKEQANADAKAFGERANRPAPAPAADPKPAAVTKPKPKSKRASDAREAEAARAAYFTPGNIVRSYYGFDEVLEYRAPTQEGGEWSVKVHEVKELDGKWVRVGKPQDARVHSTQPTSAELERGPHAKVSPAAGADVPYTSPRADGQPFTNAPTRGVEKATTQDPPVADNRVPSLFDKEGRPDPRNSPPMQDLDGFKVGDRVRVKGRTFGEGRITTLFTRQLAGLDPAKMARLESDEGKSPLDAQTFELEKVAAAPAPSPKPPLATAAPAPAPAPATATAADPKPDPLTEQEKAAKAKMLGAAAKLAQLLSKNTRLNITPEQEQAMLPIVIELFEGAMDLGYVKFKQAARYVRKFIAEAIDQDAADAIPLDTLQGAYIATARRHQDKDITPKGEVVTTEMSDILAGDEVENQPGTADTANQEATNERTDRIPEVGDGDPPRVQAPGGGGRARRTTAPGAGNDPQDLGARQPQDVDQPAPPDADGATGPGAAGSDVRPQQGTARGGNAGDGRTRASRAGDPDAGARGARAGQPESAGGTGGIAGGIPADGGAVPAGPVVAPTSPAAPSAGDFVITDPLRIVGGGQVARFEKNKAAIELRNALMESGEKPSREQQEVLAGYTGWGSFGQELFQGTWDKPAPKSGWEARDRWLRDNLGRREWEGMQESIINAHYTDPPTVMAMWDMVRRMGFQGGRVLEPSIGIGNFFGMMPPDLAARSQRAGIELDPVTGSMAQLLYPEANIQIKGFEESKTPDNFYDLVIGNWPFFEQGPADRRYNRLNPTLHDYFFLKAIDQVKPGGLVVGITTKGTMDKKGISARLAMASKAELVAAFRLPTGAFEEYAGTKVVTDIIILRKRDKPLGIAANEPWVEALEHPTAEGTPVLVNKYFHDNPSHVIGRIDFGHGTTTFRPGLIVHRPPDMAEQLKRIVQLVPEGAFRADRPAEQVAYLANHTKDRTNALTYSDKGLFIVRGDYLAPANEIRKYAVKSEKDTQRRENELRALVDMRRMYGRLIEAERTGNAETERTDLRNAYNAFQASFGILSKSFGLDYLEKIGDPFHPALAALQSPVDRGDKVDYRPAAILTASTTRGRPRMESPSITDAFVLARGETINPSVEAVAALAGKPVDEVKRTLIESGAVFEMPNGDIEPSDLYLSGNVRQKMREAQAAKQAGNDAMDRNIAALEKVMPADVPYYKIETQMGATWVPPSVYADFIAHMLGLNSSASIEVAYKNGGWSINFPSEINNRAEASSGYGSQNARFKRLVRAAISNQTINVKRKDSDGVEYVDDEATKEVNGKISDMRMKFGEWLWSDPVRRADLEREYNEVRNAYAVAKFDGSFLGFQGMALSLGRGAFNLREHQVNAIWRALVTRKSLNAHEVGTGKTFTMGGIAVESRRYGIAKKPMVVAHNANSKSVAHEIQQMYPGAKVLYIDNLSKDNISIRMMQIANDDWDAVVIPHSVLDRIGFKESTLKDMAKEEIRDLEIAAEDAADEDGVKIESAMWDDEDELKKLRSPTAKQLVKQRMKIMATIQKLAQQASKEGAVSFEDLGVDMLLVDEAHEFKKPPIATKMKMKGLQTQTSNRSIGMMFLTRYVRAMNGGGNVHLFTGTPVTNTMTEVFHMMRYMMQEEMSDAGLSDWDGWFGSFAREVSDVELTATGDYEAVTRLQSFINVPELRRMIGQYMDVVFADDMPEMQPRKVGGKTLADKDLTEMERGQLLNGRTENALDRPYKKVINESSDMSPEQMRVFEQVRSWANAWRNMPKKARKDAMSRGAPESPIIHEGIAAKASFDVRLVDGIKNAGKEGSPEMEPHPDSKPARVLRNLLELYRGHPQANQVVFMEQGMAKTVTRREGPMGQKRDVTYPSFSTLHDMIARLVQAGVPPEHIAYVDGSTSKDRRKEIADAMNEGKIRIVFGSSDSLGVGVNMQRNLRAMHHMDAPWMPGELEQRNGRGHRQGNQWNTVLEYRYLTDRLDGRRWQVLAIKQRFITEFMKSNGDVRVIEGDAAAEDGGDIISTFSDAAGDPRVLLREKYKKQLEQLQSRERMHSAAKADAIRTVRGQRQMVESLSAQLQAVRDAGTIDKVGDLLNKQREAFTATIGGKTFDKRADAGDAVRAWVNDNMRIGDEKVVGTYGGYELRADWPKTFDSPMLALTVDDFTATSTGPSILSLEADLRSYWSTTEADFEKKINRAAERAKHAQSVVDEPFHMADRLKAVAQQLADLEQDIDRNPVAPPFWLRTGAPADTEVFRDGKAYVVTGHRWSNAGWFVLARDGRGELAIPYMEAKDAQGLPLYEEREFEAPKVITKNPAMGASVGPASSKLPPGLYLVTRDDGTVEDTPRDLSVDDIDELLRHGWKITPAPAAPDGQFSRAQMRRGDRSVGRELRITAIQEAISRLTADWLRRPDIHVLDSMDDAPEPVRQVWQRQNSQGGTGDIEGFHYRGGVYLVADALTSEADVRRVLFHETLGHWGLRGLYGDELKPILQQIAAMRGVLVARKAKQYGLDMKIEAERLMAAEEVLAEISQDRPDLGWVQRAIAVIRRFLRRLGVTIGLSDNDIIHDYILPARNWVERGRSTAPEFSYRNTVAPQSSRNGSLGDAETLADILQSDAFGKHGLRGLEIPRQRVVLKAMVSILHDRKIANRVIQLVPVNVVHNLAGRKGPPQMLLHDDAVLKKIAASFADDSVATVPDEASALVLATALVAAEQSIPADKRLLALNLDAAMKTIAADLATAMKADAGVTTERAAAWANVLRLAGEVGTAVGAGKIQDTHSVTPTSDGVLGAGDASTSSAPPSVSAQTAFARAPAIDSDAFRRWFGDSKVVDAEGKPLVVYHGSPQGGFDEFDVSNVGAFFSSRYDIAASYAGAYDDVQLPEPGAEFYDENKGVYSTYLKIENPLTIDWGGNDWGNGPEGLRLDEWANRAKRAGHDGLIVENVVDTGWLNPGAVTDKGDGTVYVAFRPEQIKSATGNRGTFDAENPNIMFSRSTIAGATGRQYTPEQQRAFRNVGFEVDQPSLKERAQALWKDAGKKMAQGIADQFRPVKDIDQTAYSLLRLSKGASGAFETMLHGGRLKLTDGVYDFDEKARGGILDSLLIPLQGEHHDFFRWVAANRAERLMREGRENLFTPQDIAALKTLASGQLAQDFTLKHGPRAGQTTRDRAEAYRDSLVTFNQFNKNVLDLAEQSGLIDGENRHLWEHEFYVPFYRVADEDGSIRGANIKTGVVRQEAFKQLKGGGQKLNVDLLDNTLLNWAHLLDAAAKNRGAKATLEAAQRMGVAIEAPESTARQIGTATGNKQGVVWFMDQGQKRFFVVDDPYVLTALTSLEYAGMRNPVMDAMSAFKHALTVGVTASPFFKIRNLIRDSVQVIGTSQIGANPLANVAEGWKRTDPKSDDYFRLLAGGGTIHFGSMYEGSEAKRVQALVESGVDASTILDSPNKVKAFYRRYIEPGITAYNELGNRGEAVNRAALYNQLRSQGVGHAEASLQARDLMDFSMQGSFTTIRFLTQVVPFMNARIQGMYKLGRGAKEDPARFAAVIGATALLSIALLAAYSDDDDWKKREEWDRNNYWWFKFGGTAFRIPKPFEIGAMATLAERSWELAFDEEMTGRRFRKQVQTLLADNLSMNPIPQLIKPVVDVYANKDSFTDRPIETMNMERLRSEYRFTDRTSMLARGASTAMNSVTGLLGAEGLSPVQIDHMLRGYFGWLGAFVVGAADTVARPATNQPSHPAPDYWKSVTGGMAADLRDAPSRYVSQMYDQAKEIERAYGTWRMLLREGKGEEAQAFREANADLLNRYKEVERVKKAESALNARARMIERSDMDPERKRELLRQINEQKDRVARVAA